MQILQVARSFTAPKNAMGCRKLLGLFWRWLGKTGIKLVQVSLEASLAIVWQASEFDAHADSGIARSNGDGGGDALLIDPELHLKCGGDSQRHRGLNITTVSTDVGGVHPHGGVHALIAK